MKTRRDYTVLQVEVRTTGTTTTRSELAAVAAYLRAISGQDVLSEGDVVTMIGAMSVRIACWEEEETIDPSDGSIVRRRVARAPEE